MLCEGLHSSPRIRRKDLQTRCRADDRICSSFYRHTVEQKHAAIDEFTQLAAEIGPQGFQHSRQSACSDVVIGRARQGAGTCPEPNRWHLTIFAYVRCTVYDLQMYPLSEPALLMDTFGRVATDLRVSLTDRCDLRCSYCMPAVGLPWLPREELLTDAEVNRLVRIAVERLGVREVRFTGGEPLLRPDIEKIIAATAHLSPRPQISLTTNGVGLADRASALAAAGLDRINVSLDTLSHQTFRELARRDRLDDVLAGLEAAQHAGLTPVKVNTVLLRDVNDHEAADLLAWCLDRDYELRFIEQMPLDPVHAWQRDNFVTVAEIVHMLEDRWVLTPDHHERGGAPAERWLVDGGPATVGIIGSVSRPFCADCDRTRLTADGQVRSCLFAHDETDLRGLLRADAADDDIVLAWRQAMHAKKRGHGLDDPTTFVSPQRPMSAIGG